MSPLTESDLLGVLEKLRALPVETECVEFKESKRNFGGRELGKYVSALANEACLAGRSCGWLVLGVRDADHAVVGTAYRSDPAKLQSLKHEIAQQLTGGLTVQAIHEVNHPQGRVLLFQIPPAPAGIPIAYLGHYYARDGESLIALNIEKQDRIRYMDQTKDWTAGIIKGVGLETLDPDALREARASFAAKFASKPIARDCVQWNDATFCDKARLTHDGQITRTALLLIGKPESAHHLEPALPQITWKLEGEQRAYEHFGPPYLMTVNDLYSRIRNLKQRIIPANRLIPVEMDAYDKWVVLEALHNCVAHQDYTRGHRIIVTERPDRLVFENAGSFFEGSVEDYTTGERTPGRYRNPFLAQAMVNLNMIDTMGYGIHRMFLEQRRRSFPLPDYDLSDSAKVHLTIYGRLIDENYTGLLMEARDLPLATVILLDRVQKGQQIAREDANRLRKQSLIEGRFPKLFVSARIAAATEDKAVYIRHRAFDDAHYKQMILDFLKKFGQ
ncbi:MAG: putative DNA binding domain-containing protein, partial [Desulfobacteraceae bacterium]|nr:putative DNA binding domain-containing protein [Desulfobacteraceae bacterium]